VQVAAGTDLAYELARKHGVKVPWAATSCTTRSSRRVRALGSRS
jgi:hypothetical protein